MKAFKTIVEKIGVTALVLLAIALTYGLNRLAYHFLPATP